MIKIIKQYFRFKPREKYAFYAVITGVLGLIPFLLYDPLSLLSNLSNENRAYLILTIFGVAMTMTAMVSHRATACQQATLTVMNELHSERMLKGREVVRRLYNAHNAPNQCEQCVAQSIFCDQNEEDLHNFYVFASYMEHLAIGLENGIYDLKMVKTSFEKDIYTYYEAAEPLIKIVRQNVMGGDPKKQLYETFKALAEEFQHR